MWPWILGSAALGGLQSYQKSGGDIGKTLTGAAIGGGLGALIPGAGNVATRFAGAKLAPMLEPMLGSSLSAASAARQLPLIGGLLPKAGTLAQEAALGSKVSAAAKAMQNVPKLAGSLTTAGLGMAVPAVAAGLSGVPGRAASAATGGARSAAGAAGGAAGLVRTATFNPEELTPYQYQTGAVPGIDQYGYPGLIEQQNPLGPWQANLQYQKQQQDVENQNIARLANFQVGLADEVKKRDLQRSAAMSQLKTNLATLSALQLGGQQAAAGQATQALANIGAIAGTQYNY